MSLAEFILTLFLLVVVVPILAAILAFMIMKFGAAGYYRAKKEHIQSHYRKKEPKQRKTENVCQDQRPNEEN